MQFVTYNRIFMGVINKTQKTEFMKNLLCLVKLPNKAAFIILVARQSVNE